MIRTLNFEWENTFHVLYSDRTPDLPADMELHMTRLAYEELGAAEQIKLTIERDDGDN